MLLLETLLTVFCQLNFFSLFHLIWLKEPFFDVVISVELWGGFYYNTIMFLCNSISLLHLLDNPLLVILNGKRPQQPFIFYFYFFSCLNMQVWFSNIQLPFPHGKAPLEIRSWFLELNLAGLLVFLG